MPIVDGTLLDDGGAVVNVMHPDFGAVGNGVTDDADAIHAAVAHAAALGGAWVTLPRTHRVDDDLMFDDPRVGLQLQAGARIRPAEGRLVRVSGPLQAAGPWIDLSLGGEVDFSTGWPGVAHAEWWGATGNGVDDDSAALAAAAFVLARSGGTLAFAPGTYHLASDVSFHPSVSLLMHPGAVLRPSAGKAVTVNGPVQAGSWRWIDTGAGGRVRFGATAVRVAPPQWWGARGDGTTDATPAFAAAGDALGDAGGGTLVLPPGAYRLATSVSLPATVALQVHAGATVKPAADAILLLEGPVEAPDRHWIDRSLEGLVLFDRVNAVVSPQWWGAVADGTTDCSAALNEADSAAYSAIAGTIRLPAGRYAVAEDITIGANGSGLRVEPGAILQPAAGVTITLCIPLSVMAMQWIDLVDGGKVVILPIAGVEIIPHWWGAYGDGQGNDGPALQQALEAIAAAGGGRLFLPAGEYPVEAQVQVAGSNVAIEGVGDGTVLRAGWSPELAAQHLLRVENNASSVGVARLRMVGTGAAQAGPGGVHAGVGTRGVWVERCTFESFGAAGGTDHSGSTGGGVRDCAFRQSARGAVLSGTLGPQDVTVSGCDFEDVRVSIDVQFGSGSLVTANAIRYTAAFPDATEFEVVGIRVLGQGGTRVIGNEIDSRAWAVATEQQIDAAIRLGGNDEQASLPNCGFPNRVLVMGNVIRGGVFMAIELLGAHDCDVVNNQVESLSSESGVDYGIMLGMNLGTDPYTATTRTSVSGNRVDVSECGCGTAITEMYNGSPQGNAITNNPRVSGPTDIALIDTDSDSDVEVRDNGGFPTAASGTATVAAADTSVAVTTGIACRLSAARILLTPLSSPGAATRFWVQNVDDANRTFEIALDAAPGGTGAEFAWRVMP